MAGSFRPCPHHQATTEPLKTHESPSQGAGPIRRPSTSELQGRPLRQSRTVRGAGRRQRHHARASCHLLAAGTCPEPQQQGRRRPDTTRHPSSPFGNRPRTNQIRAAALAQDGSLLSATMLGALLQSGDSEAEAELSRRAENADLEAAGELASATGLSTTAGQVIIDIAHSPEPAELPRLRVGHVYIDQSAARPRQPGRARDVQLRRPPPPSSRGSCRPSARGVVLGRCPGAGRTEGARNEFDSAGGRGVTVGRVVTGGAVVTGGRRRTEARGDGMPARRSTGGSRSHRRRTGGRASSGPVRPGAPGRRHRAGAGGTQRLQLPQLPERAPGWRPNCGNCLRNVSCRFRTRVNRTGRSS